MKILQVCKKFPYPTRDGESVAIFNLARALHDQGAEVHLLAMNTAKHYYDLDRFGLPESFDFYRSVSAVPVDNQLYSRDAFLNLFSRKSYHIQRFVSEEFQHRLSTLLETEAFDLVQLETPYLAVYIDTIRKQSDAKIAMRAHNVEFEIWERISRNTSWGPKKWYLHYLTKKLRRFEVQQLSNYDLLAAITQRDLERFRALGYRDKGAVIPVGFEFEDYIPEYGRSAGVPTIGFIGSLDWMPNLEGLDWFLQVVWPELHQQFPELEFHIAGRQTPDRILNLQIPKVLVHGEVPDSRHFLSQHAILLVPLFSGSGMRVKILEGMALGKVVLTTKIGLEGIDAQHGKHLLIANNAEEFSIEVGKCLNNNYDLVAMGKAARSLVVQQFNRNTLAKRLLGAYDSVRKTNFTGS